MERIEQTINPGGQICFKVVDIYKECCVFDVKFQAGGIYFLTAIRGKIYLKFCHKVRIRCSNCPADKEYMLEEHACSFYA